MDLNPLALVITSLTSIGIAAAGLLRAPDRPSSRLCAFNALWVALWAALTHRLVTAQDPETAIIILRALHPVSALVMASFVDFVWVFPERLKLAPWPQRAALYGAALVFGGIATHPDLVRQLDLTPSGPDVKFGWPLLALAPFLACSIIHVNAVLWHKYRTQVGTRRVQVVYVLAGTLTFELIAFVVNVVLPLATDKTTYSKWGVVGYLFTGVAIAIAIAKHRLWDLGSLTRRAAASALAVASILLVGSVGVALVAPHMEGAAMSPVTSAVVWMCMGTALGLALPGVYNAYRGILSHSLTEERARIGTLLDELGAAIVHAPLGDAALVPILEQTVWFFHAVSAAAYLKGPDGLFRAGGTARHASELPEPGTPAPPDPLPPGIANTLALARLAEPIDAGELTRFGSVTQSAGQLAAMEALDASVIVPLDWQGETIGILMIGRKLSLDMYSSTDLSLLRSIAAHAAISLKNAQLRADMMRETERTEKVFAEMSSGVMATDAAGTVVLSNPAACSLLATEGEELLGHHLSILPPGLAGPLRAALAEGATISAVRTSVGRLAVACSSFVLRGVGGAVDGAGVVFRDLRTEDALRRVERETERLRFIRAVSAGMAHEIRNPLVAIRTFAELAPSRLDDPEFRTTFLEVAKGEVSRLEDLVTQFLDLAKPTRTVREPTDLAALSARANASLQAVAQGRGVFCSVHVAGDLPQPGADEPRLYQAVTNLLHNALDATPEGGSIRVSAVVEQNEFGDDTTVALSVWNSGSYIPPEVRERVFEPFFTSKPTGTGLGLAICNTIIYEHGGTMAVESNPDTGTSFTIRLPITPVAAAPALEPA